jgi:DNA-binding transcriptional regulator YdaS (Cro superfamily)
MKKILSKRQQDIIRSREWVALDTVVKRVGSKTKLGAMLDVSYQAVQNWYTSRVPLEHCPLMETFTRGEVQCEQLRDDYRDLDQRPYRKAHNIYRAGDEPRIYIAGPMTGYPELNHPAFHAEAARLRAAGLNVVSPAEVTLDGNPTWFDYMRADLRLMMRCSTICLLPGWRRSKGARIEYLVAKCLGFEVMHAGEGA